MGSPEFENKVRIKIDETNSFYGYFPDGKRIKLCADTGAARTIVSLHTVINNEFLRKIQMERTSHYSFFTGNDSVIDSHMAMRIPITTQEGVQINLTAHVAQRMTENLILVGADNRHRCLGKMGIS